MVVVYGIGVGVFAVEREAGAVRVREDIGDVVVIGRDAAGQAAPAAPQPRSSPSLDKFKSELRALVAQPRAPMMDPHVIAPAGKPSVLAPGHAG
jgi:hypothetical protein